MYRIREYRKNPDRLIDLLPWAALVGPGAILNKDGSFQKTLMFRGPDLDSATETELVAVASRFNNVFKRLGSGWAIFAEAQRSLSSTYLQCDFPDLVSRGIDEERRKNFADNDHFESFYYLTLVFLPPSDASNKLAAFFIENSSKIGVDYKSQLNLFNIEVGRLLDLLQDVIPEIRPLNDDETLTYLHSTISFKRHPVKCPEIPMYLDAILADTPLIGGLEPRLGQTGFRAISVLGFPGTSTPGILDTLNRLAVEYRWITRFIPMDKEEGSKELTRYKRKWFSKRKGMVTLLKEMVSGSESVMVDSDAENKAYDADEALQELADDAVSYGYFTATIIVWEDNQERLDTKTRSVEKVINSLGFTTITESMNAVEAWLGAVPGHCRANVRRPILNTMNLTHLLPVSAVWAGPERNRHFNAPVLFNAVTSGSTPFRVSLHVGDVGHAMVVGPTGSGKSVLLALIEAQFRRYENAQVYIFDKGGSARAITAGVGGDFYDLGEEGGLSFQPLALVDDELERSWATEWILDRLRGENIEIDPMVKQEVWVGLTSLASAPVEQRTISGLIALLQSSLLRQALHPYSIDGPHGHLLDATGDSLNYGNWQCFEMEHIMNTPSVVPAVLSYLFHRLEKRFTGKPSILVLDEAWVFFDNHIFAAKIREWLKVLRKANVSVIFATQSLADIVNSPISTALIESCPTRIFLPNDKALEDSTAEIYRQFGLNDRQIRLLALATPKREYYYQSPMGNRLFELGLGPLALAYCAAGGKEDQRAIKSILAEHGKEGFNASWAEYKGVN
ncbi:MAG: conjugal transfer protein TrbE [Desulfuromonadales bacterium]|nr:conjugal transfer protein TrbE [Desulfuromonadales bacterium]